MRKTVKSVFLFEVNLPEFKRDDLPDFISNTNNCKGLSDNPIGLTDLKTEGIALIQGFISMNFNTFKN